ncbi:MAG: hypothetical protein AAF959_16410 [Cyanobacteria bacterium P01_D01_bin.56]
MSLSSNKAVQFYGHSQEIADKLWGMESVEQLKQREVVNIRAESDAKTAYASVDQKWVLRVLKRITADLDHLSSQVQLDEKI